jgi:hypothetical protein
MVDDVGVSRCDLTEFAARAEAHAPKRWLILFDNNEFFGQVAEGGV